MALRKLHRVLVALGILFFFALGLYTLRHADVTRRGLATGIASVALAVGLGAGQVYFNYKRHIWTADGAGGAARAGTGPS
jgi:hypothetical protein